MSGLLRPLTLAVVAVAAATAAHAQEISPLEPPDTSRYLQWGPLRVRPGLIIPTFGYDDNVYAIPNDSTLPKVGDYFIALAPRAEGLVLFKHWAFLTFDEKLEFYLYAPLKDSEKVAGIDLNYFNQFGRARITVPFRGGKVWTIWASLLGGFVAMCAGDILYAYFATFGKAWLESILDALYVLAYVLVARATAKQLEAIRA